MTITIEEIQADHAALAAKIAAYETAKAAAAVPRTVSIPAATITLADGEIYAGLVLNDDGSPSHHLVLLSGETKADWADSKAWAQKVGGTLPTRREQSLLFAHAKASFQQRYYWSSEAHENGSYACMQYFNNGDQHWYYVDNEHCARAVRRFVA